jgi:hypothetical protein
MSGSDGRYEWMRRRRRRSDPDVPAALEIEVIPDSAPRIEILAPATDTTVSALDTIPLSFLARMIMGLPRLLRVWRQPEAGVASPETTRPLLSQPMTQWTGDATLSLPALGVLAGEPYTSSRPPSMVAVATEGLEPRARPSGSWA